MDAQSQTNVDGSPVTVRQINWLDVLKRHIACMKGREDQHRRESEDLQLKLSVTMKERMELEHFIYKTQNDL